MLQALLLKFPWLSIAGRGTKAVFKFLFKWVEVPVILLVALALHSLWAGLEIRSASKALAESEAKVATLEAALVECKEASARNVEAVYVLQRKLVECVGDNAATDAAQAEMAKVANGYIAAMQRQINQMREERNAIYEKHQSCAVHRTQPVCGALDERLRRLGAGPN